MVIYKSRNWSFTWWLFTQLRLVQEDRQQSQMVHTMQLRRINGIACFRGLGSVLWSPGGGGGASSGVKLD